MHVVEAEHLWCQPFQRRHRSSGVWHVKILLCGMCVAGNFQVCVVVFPGCVACVWP